MRLSLTNRLAFVGLLLATPVTLLFVQHEMRMTQEQQVHAQESAAATTASGQTFRDPADYTVPVPEGWLLADHTKQNQLIRADITRSYNAGVQIRLQKCPSGNCPEIAEAVFQQYKRDMSTHWGGECVELRRESASPGRNITTRGFRLDRKDGQRWYLHLTCVDAKDKLIVMQGGCLWDERQAFSDALNTMASGIQIEPTAQGD